MSGDKKRLLQSDNDSSVAAEEDRAAKRANDKIVLILFVIMFVVGLGNRMMSKIATIPLFNYGLALNMCLTLMYVPFSGGFVLWTILFKKHHIISPESRSMSKKVFLVCGSLDSIAGLMLTVASTYITSGTMVVLLTQAAVPASMVISKIILRAKYQISHYVGALVVGVGLVLSLLPQFLHPDHHAKGGKNQVLWSMVLLAGSVPTALSCVYKEQAFKDTKIEVHPIYLNYWVAVFQAMWSIPFSIPLAYLSGLNIQTLPKNYFDGVKCILGMNSIKHATGSQVVDNCARAPAYFTAYALFNLAFNVTLIFTIQKASAAHLWTSLTIMVPLSALGFAIPWMPASAPLSPWVIVGMIVILAGLVIYRFSEYVIEFWDRARGVEVIADPDTGSHHTDVLEDISPLSIEGRALLYQSATDDTMSSGSFGTSGVAWMGNSFEAALASGVLEHHMRRRRRTMAMRRHQNPRKMYFSRLGIPAQRSHTSMQAGV